MTTKEETAGNLLNAIFYETRVNVLLQVSMSFFILTNNLLKQRAIDSPDDEKLRENVVFYNSTVQKFRKDVYAKVDYSPGSQNYIGTMSNVMQTVDVLLEYAFRYDLITMPAGAGKYSSWGDSYE